MAASISKIAGFSPGVSFSRNTSRLSFRHSRAFPRGLGSTLSSTTSPRLLTVAT